MTATDSRLIVSEEVSIPLAEFRFVSTRSSGPGGQNVNKVNSQVQLHWDLEATQSLPAEVLQRLKESERGRITREGVLRLDCQRFRTRIRNREDCLERLRQILLPLLEAPRKRRKTRTPRRVREERLRQKQQRGAVKRSRRAPRLDDER